MKRGYSQLNSSKETTQENYSIEKSEPANDKLDYQELLRNAAQTQKNLEALLKQCKQHSDQMPKPHYSLEEEFPETVSDKCFQSSCSSKLLSKIAQPNEGNTPTMHREDCKNDIGSQSRTSSVNSHPTTSSGSSRMPSKRSQQRQAGKTPPSENRHFKYLPMTITLTEFNNRLETKLSEDILQFQLQSTFPALHQFRTNYIIPLSEKFRGHRHIDLLDLPETDEDLHFRIGLMDSYNKVFVEGCHIPREARKAGQPAIPETEERVMYRWLISDLWEILGWFLH
jgi:hypothetical protein